MYSNRLGLVGITLLAACVLHAQTLNRQPTTATLSFVALAIASGLYFTIHEFRRLSSAAAVQHASTQVLHLEPFAAARFDAMARISRTSTFSDVKGGSD